MPDGAPPRLVETPGPAGDCLRQALAASPDAPDVPAFSILRERRQRRLRRQKTVLVASLSAVALLVGIRATRRGEESMSVRAERFSASPRQPAAPSRAPEAKPALPEPMRVNPPNSEVSAPRARSTPKRSEPRRRAENTSSNPPATQRGARGCAELARSGAAERARGCYEELAKGSGITAELALFEQARLEGKALRRPEQALKTLDSYRERFPNGSLRAEVMLARIDWLLRAGDRGRALQLVDEALASGELQERRPELERLRATLSSP